MVLKVELVTNITNPCKSHNPLQGIHRIKIIFLVILRCCLLHTCCLTIYSGVLGGICDIWHPIKWMQKQIWTLSSFFNKIDYSRDLQKCERMPLFSWNFSCLGKYNYFFIKYGHYIKMSWVCHYKIYSYT